MNSQVSSEQMSRRAAPLEPSLSTSAAFDAEEVQRDDLGKTLSQLSRDVASLKDTFALLASQAGGTAAKTMRDMTETVASQMGDAASAVSDKSSDLATSAKQHAKTVASEMESMARRHPLGTITGTLVVGIIIGMMSRGRG